MLAFACVLVTGGRLGDTYGRKKMFLWGMAGFTVASAVCGAAPDIVTLIAARVVQGMSSGLMFPQVLGIIQVIFSKAQRTRAITFYGATIGLATILGPVTASPAPAPVKAKIAAAVQDTAFPAARRYDLEHSMRTTLDWQLGVFFVALLLVTRLPKVKLDGDALMPGDA